MSQQKGKGRLPKRPEALKNLLNKGRSAAPAPAREANPNTIGVAPSPEDWSRAVRDQQLTEAERELAALRETALSHRKFLSVLEAQSLISLAGDPDQLVHNTLQMAMDLVGAERGAFYRLDKRGGLRLRQALPSGSRFENISRTLVRDALLNRRTRYHLGGESVLGLERDSIVDLGLETVVVVPLEAGETLMGVLYLDGRSRGDFSAGDLPSLEMLTRMAAGAMRRLDELNKARKTGRRLELENRELRSVISDRARLGRISAESPAMTRVIGRLRRIIPLKTTLRLEGETGTGKTLIARVLHEEGPWSEGSFVPINCSAIPETLIEAELFGFIRGAFTGAVQNRLGLIEQADGGTLFLDEIGDLPLDVQGKILGVLEEGEIRRIGENQDRRVDFRLIVATHRDLRKLVEEGRFREDLFYRIDVLSIRVPPLRDRGEDIRLLAEESLAFYAQRLNMEKPRLSVEALRKLMNYPWPGNVRQLMKCIEGSMALRDPGPVLSGPELLLDDLSPGLLAGARPDETLKLYLRRMERSQIELSLEQYEGNVTVAARALSISRQTLHEKIRMYNLTR